MSTAMAGGWVRDGRRLRRRLPQGGYETVSIGPKSWYTGEVDADGEPIARSASVAAARAPRRRRSARSSVTAVYFTERAYEDLCAEVMESLDGREAAAGLYGYEDDGTLVIVGAGSPCPSANRASDATSIDHSHVRSQEGRFVGRDLRAVWCGDWHSHVYPHSFSCSDTDTRAWERGAQLVHDPYVGVIAFTGDDDGTNPYYKPGLRAWAATAAGCAAVPIEFEEQA